MSVAYFVQFRNAAGQIITSPSGKQWFSIPAADFSFTRPASVSPQGIQVGALTPGALSLSLGANSLDSTLLSALTAGAGLSSIEIAAYSTINGTTYLSDDYQFSSLGVTSVTSAADSADLFSFSYSRYQEAHRTSAGATLNETGWDFATGAALQSFSSVFSGAQPTTNNGSAAPALTYYVQVTNASGTTIQNDAGSAWIEVTNPSFSIANSGTAKAGALTFSLAASSATQALQTAILAGANLRTVELASYDASGKLVDDTTFATVLGTNATIDASNGGAPSFSFVYGAYQDVQTAATSTGGSTTTATGWNFQTAAPDTSLPATAPTSAPGASAATSNAPTAYLVEFKSSPGILTSPSGKQWFSIPAADFSFTRPASVSPQGIQVGALTAGALSLSLGANSLDSTLLTALTAGAGLSSIEIAGYSTVNGTTYLSDDYQFSSLGVTSVTSAADSADLFSFSYSKYQEAHSASAGATLNETGWNFATGAALQSFSSVFSGAQPTTNNGSATPALTYYVEITNASGTTIQNDAGSAWIEVTNPSFSIANSGTAKAGALSFSLAASSATQALQTAILAGANLRTVELASYNASGTLVDDNTFATVLGTNATVDASNGGAQSFSFVYGAYQDVQTATTSSGGSTTTATGWNFQTVAPDTSLPSAAPTSAPGASAATSNAPTAYLVEFKSSSGTLLSPSLKQWFSIPAADFAFTRPASVSAQGVQAGALTAGALSLSLGADGIDSTLLTALTAGAGLSSLEIAGYSTVSGTTYLSDDYQFSGLGVTSVTSAADSADLFSFSYSRYQEAHRTSAGATLNETGWNFASGTALQSFSPVLSGVQPTTNNGSATPALTYYVEITNASGTTIQNDAGAGWIEATDPSFSIANSGTAKAGVLSFSLAASSATQALQTAILAGANLRTVELASYDASGKLVDDTTFATVLGTNATVDASNSGAQSFSFVYGAYQDLQTATTSSGGSTTTAANWNFQTTAPDTSLPATAPQTICFLAGTEIATPDGERPIETLRRGDLVLTHDGRSVPVLWLGVQTVSRRFADPLRTLPIRIRAGALADKVPKRDLFVSPDHALLVDGALIQAGALVNATSIAREASTPETYKYYHVETQDHSLILAEGAPAETFVDNVDRMHFDNWAEHEALYSDGRPIGEMDLPRAKAGRQVPLATRARLDRRAAARYGRVA